MVSKAFGLAGDKREIVVVCSRVLTWLRARVRDMADDLSGLDVEAVLDDLPKPDVEAVLDEFPDRDIDELLDDLPEPEFDDLLDLPDTD